MEIARARYVAFRYVAFWVGLVLFGVGLSEADGKVPAVKPRFSPKSSITAARGTARRAHLAQRSVFSARVSVVPAASPRSGAGSQGMDGRAAVAAHAPEVSLHGLRSPEQVDDPTLSAVQSRLAGLPRRMTFPGRLNVLRAANLSDAGGKPEIQAASENITKGKAPSPQRPAFSGVHSVNQPFLRAFTNCTETVTDQDMYVIRYINPDSRQTGPWFTPNLEPLSSLDAYDRLALPGKPTAYVRVKIPKGTLILQGLCAPVGAHKGGHPQIYVPDLELQPTGPPQPLPAATR